MPPWIYAEMEKEFNRRQMAGEPCEDLVRVMAAVLTVPMQWVRMDVAPDHPPEPAGNPLERILRNMRPRGEAA